jgi:NAD(P)-dependent dehydrogenase (short-subunit alcohol dehydrogenase family)
MKIGVLSRTDKEAKATVDEIHSAGGEAINLIADISSPDQMQKAAADLGSRWGRIDFVFANAGINGVWAPLDELEPEEWDRTLDINLKGTFLTVKYSLPFLRKNGGSIVITSSINGTRTFSNTGATAYSCSKAAQVAFAKMMAVELGQDRIRVNVVCPGAIETQIDENTERRNIDEVKIPVEYPEGGQIPITGDRPGTSEQVANLVHFFASRASSHITGTEIWIDGGQSLL